MKGRYMKKFLPAIAIILYASIVLADITTVQPTGDISIATNGAVTVTAINGRTVGNTFTDTNWCRFLTASGLVCDQAAPSTGAPADAHYITTQAETGLSAETAASANGVTLIGHTFAQMLTDLGITALGTTTPGTGVATAAGNAVDAANGLATYGHTVQYAATPTIDDPDNWTMSGAGMYGGTWIANAAGTGNLPAVAAGMNLTVTVEGTGVARLNPNGSEVIYLNGTACSAGYDIYNSGTTGDAVVLQYRASGSWLATAKGWSCGS
jgi:hypothetical protein